MDTAVSRPSAARHVGSSATMARAFPDYAEAITKHGLRTHEIAMQTDLSHRLAASRCLQFHLGQQQRLTHPALLHLPVSAVRCHHRRLPDAQPCRCSHLSTHHSLEPTAHSLRGQTAYATPCASPLAHL